MTNNDSRSGILVKNIQYYQEQACFVRKITQNGLKQPLLKEKTLKEIEQIQKIIKTIKKQQKELKLNELQLIEIYGSSFQFIENKVRQISYPLKIQKTDFEFYLMKKRLKQNENTCVITLNIQTQKYDDRMLIDADLTSIFDVQSLIVKAAQILKNFKYHQVTPQNNCQSDTFLHQITKNYNVVPFHNFTHAFSVFSMFYYFSKSQSLSHWFNDFQLYFCLISCLCHDLRHNGFNSVFQMKNKSQIAMNFGNISIMQKMHRSVAFQILESLGQNSPLSQLGVEQTKYARKIISNCILATDMSKHYDYVSSLTGKKLNSSKPADKMLMIQSLIHACDIGNPMLDYENYITWANLVCVQFHQQTVQESLFGIEPTHHLRFESLNYFYKNQTTFLNTVVLPMWQALDYQLDESKIKQKLSIIKENSGKVCEQMRRNSSDSEPRKGLARYFQVLLKEIKP